LKNENLFLGIRPINVIVLKKLMNTHTDGYKEMPGYMTWILDIDQRRGHCGKDGHSRAMND
jgi:hypothetical protein